MTVVYTLMNGIAIYFYDVYIQLDINECLTDNGGCAHNCNNTAGSYQCYCEDGYKLNSDDHTCDGKISTINCSMLKCFC